MHTEEGEIVYRRKQQQCRGTGFKLEKIEFETYKATFDVTIVEIDSKFLKNERYSRARATLIC